VAGGGASAALGRRGGRARCCVCVCGPAGTHCVDKAPYLQRLNRAVVDKVLSTSAELGPS
jgi:hypothetical protein